jgi:hypothetical protein
MLELQAYSTMPSYSKFYFENVFKNSASVQSFHCFRLILLTFNSWNSAMFHSQYLSSHDLHIQDESLMPQQPLCRDFHAPRTSVRALGYTFTTQRLPVSLYTVTAMLKFTNNLEVFYSGLPDFLSQMCPHFLLSTNEPFSVRNDDISTCLHHWLLSAALGASCRHSHGECV